MTHSRPTLTLVALVIGTIELMSVFVAKLGLTGQDLSALLAEAVAACEKAPSSTPFGSVTAASRRSAGSRP